MCRAFSRVAERREAQGSISLRAESRLLFVPSDFIRQPTDINRWIVPFMKKPSTYGPTAKAFPLRFEMTHHDAIASAKEIG